MDEIQLKYKRMYNIKDEDLNYKDFLVYSKVNGTIMNNVYHACCEEQIYDMFKGYNILRIKQL